MTDPMYPYARIVADLRRRIADGELAPGDRVPSTRQLAKEWGVALATATKALAVLRADGIVAARPRVGTVVASPRVRGGTGPGTARRSRAENRPGGERDLGRDQVVRAAIGVADAEGLAALSMRSVAARLGAATMTAYRYVNSKDELVLLMADTVLGELSLPRDPDEGRPGDWRSRLELGARALWAVHRAHPWLAQIGPLTRPLLLPSLIAYSEWMLGALDGHGLPPETMLNLNALLYSHIQGIAIQWEGEALAQSSSGLSENEWMERQAATLTSLTDSGAYPTFTRVLGSLGEEGYDLRLDELFELGLGSMLDGVAVLVERGRGPVPPHQEAGEA